MKREELGRLSRFELYKLIEGCQLQHNVFQQPLNDNNFTQTQYTRQFIILKERLKSSEDKNQKYKNKIMKMQSIIDSQQLIISQQEQLLFSQPLKSSTGSEEIDTASSNHLYNPGNIQRSKNVSSQQQQEEQKQSQLLQSNRLFENLFVLSGDTKLLSAENSVTGFVPSNILYTFPADQTVKDDILTFLKTNCFPYDVEYTREVLSSVQPSDSTIKVLHKSIIDESLAQNSSRYVLQMKGQHSLNSIKINNIIKKCNSSQTLFSVCLEVKRFFTIKHLKTGKCDIYFIPMTLCFTTFYPFFDFFLQILEKITSFLKCIQVKSSKILSGIIPLSQRNLDILQDIKNLKSQYCDNLRKSLSELQILSEGFSTGWRVNFSPNLFSIFPDISLIVPENFALIQTLYGLPTVQSILTLEELFFVLCAVWLDKKVLFFSKQKSTLAIAIQTFVSILKPFAYEYSVLSILSKQNIHYIDSSQPLIIGVNKDIGYLNELKSSYKLNDAVVVDLDASGEHIVRGNSEQNFEKLIRCMPELNEKICFAYFKSNASELNYLKNYNTFRQEFDQQSRQTVITPTTVATEDFLSYLQSWILERVNEYVTQGQLESQSIKQIIKSAQGINIASNKNNNPEFFEKFFQTQSFKRYIQQLVSQSQVQ